MKNTSWQQYECQDLTLICEMGQRCSSSGSTKHDRGLFKPSLFQNPSPDHVLCWLSTFKDAAGKIDFEGCLATHADDGSLDSTTWLLGFLWRPYHMLVPIASGSELHSSTLGLPLAGRSQKPQTKSSVGQCTTTSLPTPPPPVFFKARVPLY